MLEVKNLSVYYGKYKALRDANLRVEKGESVAVIGPNGSGKTALLRTISGLLRPKKGEISFFGERIDRLQTHEIVERGISHCPERKKLFPDMTVMENLEFGAYLRKDAKKIQRDLKEIISLFPLLKKRKNQRAKTLSGGEQQMLSIGRALLANPKLLMLDEPSLGLAPLIRERLINVIGEVHRRGVAILLVEQDLGLALGLCTRGYLLEQGRVRLEGSRKYLKGNPLVKDAYLGLI